MTSFQATSCQTKGKSVLGVLTFNGESEERRQRRNHIFIVRSRRFTVAADAHVSKLNGKVTQFGVDFYLKLEQLFRKTNCIRETYIS